MERFAIIVINSEAESFEELEYTFKRLRHSSYNRFFIEWIRQYRLPAGIWILILIKDCKRASSGMTVVSFELEQTQQYLWVDTVLCIGTSILSSFNLSTPGLTRILTEGSLKVCSKSSFLFSTSSFSFL